MKKVTDADFESVIRRSKPAVVLRFSAEWSPPSRVLAGLIRRVTLQWEDEVDFLEVDVEECPRTAARFGVDDAPALVALRDGQETERLVGLPSRPALEGFLARI